MQRIIFILLLAFIALSFSFAKEKKLETYELDNPKLYTYSKYSSAINQPIYLEIEVVDKRPLPDKDRDTTLWARPIVTMVKEVVEKELQLANIAKPPTAISSLNQYRIEIELL
ncbi:MAG: hypothetical protein QME64_09350, partial [bacterium]|nr:hypothetical protein [bacterium]